MRRKYLSFMTSEAPATEMAPVPVFFPLWVWVVVGIDIAACCVGVFSPFFLPSDHPHIVHFHHHSKIPTKKKIRNTKIIYYIFSEIWFYDGCILVLTSITWVHLLCDHYHTHSVIIIYHHIFRIRIRVSIITILCTVLSTDQKFGIHRET